MSHNMTKNDTAVYAIEQAWHGLGIVVEDFLTPKDALEQSGIDWHVAKSRGATFFYDKLTYDVETQSIVNQPCAVGSSKVVANIRVDTREILGVVGTKYKILQNYELADIAYAIAGDDTKVETMGSLNGGKQVYMLIKMNEQDVAKNDCVKSYFLLSNGHDGKMALSGKPTSIRVVCANTLDMALRGSAMFRFAHLGDKAEHITEAKAMMKQMTTSNVRFWAASKDLAKTELNTEQIQAFWLEVYGLIEGVPIVASPSSDEEHKNRRKAVNMMCTWAKSFDEERHEYGYSANAWVALNAATNWMDHRKSFRGKDKVGRRIYSSLFGKGSRVKVEMFNKALELV